MICSSGIGFDPTLDGQRLTFGFEGIWQGTAVLYDRGSTSLWMHLTGECFAGPLAGRRLTALPTGRHTRWADWKRDHPGTDVMAPDPRFAASYFLREQCRSGDRFLPADFPSTIQSRDPRLPLEELLLGVRLGAVARAYPLARLAAGAGVVEETLAGVPLTVWYDLGQRSAAAYDRRLGAETLSFLRVPGGFRERGSGSLFSLEGLGLSGPHKDLRLARPEQLLAEWYGWFAHHGATTIWAP